MSGSIYELEFIDTEFRAAGMHDAQVIQRELQKAIKRTLEDLPHVMSIDRGPYVRMKASRKNFAPVSNQDTKP